MIASDIAEAVTDACAAYQPQVAHFRYEPLTVTATLAGPLAVTRPEDLALDGLLARALLESVLGETFYSLPDAREHPLFLRLPLALQGPDMALVDNLPSGTWLDIGQHLQGRWWWYACSTARLEGIAARDTHYWNKRFDFKPEAAEHLALAPRQDTIVIEKGRYKNYHQPLPVVSCRAVSWSCVGDRAMIGALLSGIPYIGKKAAYGEGAIRQWTVEPARQDESLWTSEGRLARPIPSVILGEVAPTFSLDAPPRLAYLAYRAPQWLPYNQTVCAVWS